MKNFIDTYYDERDGACGNRDDLHIGHMGEITITSHGSICELQEEIVSVEKMCDEVFDDPDNDDLKREVLYGFNFMHVDTKDFYKYMRKYHKWLRNREEEIIDTVLDICNTNNFEYTDSEHEPDSDSEESDNE